MPEIIPYKTLPDEWAMKAHCPVCNNSPLAVVHSADNPDRMACPRCHSLFEIEEHGKRIRFISLPGILTSLLTGQWVTSEEVLQSVRTVIARQSAVRPPPSEPVKPPEPCPFTTDVSEITIPGSQPVEEPEVAPAEKPKPAPAEIPLTPPPQPVMEFQERAPVIKDINVRAQELYALGNSPDQIKAILSQDVSLYKPDIEAAVDKLYGVDASKKRRQRTWMRISLVIGLGILVGCTVSALMWQTILGTIAGKAGLPIIATLSANKSVAPLLATPVVVPEQANGAPRPPCPQTKEQASAMFGGSTDTWIPDVDDGSWFMMNSTPVTVHIPGGMNAVLVNLEGGKVNTVPGPATIYNATSLTILCR